MKSTSLKSARIAEAAAEWLVRLEEDPGLQCSDEFLAWLKHSPAHMDEFLLVTCAYRAMHGVDPDRKIDAVRLFESSTPPVVPLEQDGEHPKNERRRRRPKLIGLAAAGMLLALATWWALPFLTGVQTYSTVVGEQRTVKLAEGSVIYLNTRSRIRTHVSKTARDIELLEGEALFVVERDPSRPFRVLSGLTVVQAVGTQFNVYRRHGLTKVAVIEGSVQVVAGAQPAPLIAGEEANITSGQVLRQPAGDAARAIAWRQRQLVFHARPLSEIAEEFNRYNKLQLQVEGRTLPNRPVTGVFNADSPQALLKFLDTDASLQIERLDDTVVIRAREESAD